jgi:hypothetical protein
MFYKKKYLTESYRCFYDPLQYTYWTLIKGRWFLSHLKNLRFRNAVITDLGNCNHEF